MNDNDSTLEEQIPLDSEMLVQAAQHEQTMRNMASDQIRSII